MSRQPGGRGNGGNGANGGVARGAGFAAAKGAGLIGLSVLIGIVLLQVVDDGSSGPVDTGSGATTTTTTLPDDTDVPGDTTPETSGEPAKTPDQLRVRVYNGGAPQGAARSMSDALRQAGYTNQAQPADWQGRDQAGNVVLCREGHDREASALAIAVGGTTPTEAFPDPAPTGNDDVDCLVVVGRA